MVNITEILIEVKEVIESKADAVEVQRLITNVANTKQNLSQAVSLIEDNAIASHQLVVKQSQQLQVLGLDSSSIQASSTQQLRETLEGATDLQVQIQQSSSSSSYY